MPMNADEIRRRLEFYQDLGIKDLYKQSAAAPPVPARNSNPPPGPVVTIVAESALPVLASPLPPLAPDNDTLFQILTDIGDCRRCRLSEGRNKIVFGVGNGETSLVFVGEGPGADEDEQGI